MNEFRCFYTVLHTKTLGLATSDTSISSRSPRWYKILLVYNVKRPIHITSNNFVLKNYGMSILGGGCLTKRGRKGHRVGGIKNVHFICDILNGCSSNMTPTQTQLKYTRFSPALPIPHVPTCFDAG